jgi:hypothetical protein
MSTTAYLGLFGITAGLVLYFSSGIFSLFSASLGMIFLSIGVVFFYIGIAFVMWNVISSFNMFLESFVKRS